MASNYKTVIEKYTYFVTKNPLLASEIEVGLKWVSYIVAGRFSHSPVVTEFIHSSSNLLTLLNDSILRKAAGVPININVTIEKLKTFLSIIDYIEVFVEVAAYKISGSQGKWFSIILIHLAKFIIRLLLVLRFDDGLHHSPPIPVLNRRKDIPQLCEENGQVRQIEESNPNVEVTFTLKTSGRVIRTLEAAPPLVSRSWKLPKVDNADCHSTLRKTPAKLKGKYLTAELLHICRPLMHLVSIGVFGETSWKPFWIAMGIDVTSLHLMKQKRDFNKAEKQEINRRALSLLLYLLRSPFYDQYSKTRIINTLLSVSSSIAGSGLFLRPLIEYIPEWQKQYFYAWSS